MTTTGRDPGARALNRLPQSHWDAWYAQERRWNAALDRAVAAGLRGADAADAACRELGLS